MNKVEIFIDEAIVRLAGINAQLEHAIGTDRRALEGARDELIELVWAALDLPDKTYRTPRLSC